VIQDEALSSNNKIKELEEKKAKARASPPHTSSKQDSNQASPLTKSRLHK
jgi:hypothetical protein